VCCGPRLTVCNGNALGAVAFLEPTVAQRLGWPAIAAGQNIGDKRASAQYYARGLRHHWGIENNLHWQRAVNFAEDAKRV
jgi:predicted transposase YbfD/YdcC